MLQNPACHVGGSGSSNAWGTGPQPSCNYLDGVGSCSDELSVRCLLHADIRLMFS